MPLSIKSRGDMETETTIEYKKVDMLKRQPFQIYH